MTFSLGKFADHAAETADFEHYGIPAPEVATYLVGTLELVGGALLVVGLLTRPAAAVLAANLVGAIATAGRVDGGSFHLGAVPPCWWRCCSWCGPGPASSPSTGCCSRAPPP